MAYVPPIIPILMLISFDGFRPDYIDPYVAPTLHELSKRGSTANMESLAITKTFPNHFSMATGLYEDEHQIINNKMFDPELNATFKPGENAREWWDPNSDRIPIWTAVELFGEIKNAGKKRYSGSMMYPGSSTPYVNILPTHLKEYDTVRNWTKNVETVIGWLTDDKQPASFVSVYYDDPDNKAHEHGPWGAETLDSIKRIDKSVAYLIRRLQETNLINKTNILFVSDHGMDELNNITYLDDLIDTSGFEMYGASPTWSIFVEPGVKHELIMTELKRVAEKGNFKVTERSNIPKELHYRKSDRIGDFFIMANEKHELFKTRSKKYKKLTSWGNHGWSPKDAAMRPLFLAIGPSFKENYRHKESFPNIDLFPLMVNLLDLPIQLLPNNGTIEHIEDIIRD